VSLVPVNLTMKLTRLKNVDLLVIRHCNNYPVGRFFGRSLACPVPRLFHWSRLQGMSSGLLSCDAEDLEYMVRDEKPQIVISFELSCFVWVYENLTPIRDLS